MNKLLIMGRLTRDPDIRYGGANNTCIARMSIAVDRRFKRDGAPTADFFSCTAFGKVAEFAEKYLKKGVKVVIDGEMQNDNYKDKDGKMVYSFNVLINTIEFAESKKASKQAAQQAAGNNTEKAAGTEEKTDDDEFMNLPDSVEESLPFD